MRNRTPAWIAIFWSAFAQHVVAASLEARVHDSTGAPLADAVVYALPAIAPPEPRSRRTVAIEQVDREFVPYVSVIQAGTTVTFPNRDAILHHVYSFSPAKTFEIKLYTGQSPDAILFDRAGVVTLGCNIHDWMVAYILVVPTPHFAKTDSRGLARLPELAPGRYEVHAWHPQQRSGVAAQSFALNASGAARAVVDFDLQPRKAKYKPPLDRLRY